MMCEVHLLSGLRGGQVQNTVRLLVLTFFVEYGQEVMNIIYFKCNEQKTQRVV